MTEPVPTPSPITPPSEPDLATIQTWPTSQQITRLNELRLKMDQTGDLTPEECRLGVRLLTAMRVARAGAKGGSKDKAAAAPQAFKQMNLEDL